MPETKISSADYGNMSGVVSDFSVDVSTTDGPAEQDETTWENTNWTKYLGYYRTIPELKAVIDAKATWTVGKGFKADSETEATLNFITGWGKDTFNTIIENMIRTYNIGGDAFCEIIRNDEGDILNLKPLDPGVIIIVVDRQGRIKRYEQKSKVKSPNKKFNPENIFHLARNRVADEIHGQSMIEALETIILMRNEAMSDMKKLMHRNVVPRIVWHLDTDDTAEIAAFKTKADKAVENAENIFVPKGTVEHELLSVPTNATLNPLPWIEALKNYFFQATGVPQIIVGSSSEFTEATAKIAYLAFQQTIEEEQLFVEEQVWEQLGLKIELEFPASLENDLLSDKAKDEPINIQPNETTAGSGQ
ncbi:MAG: phage portal protein [Candidatus Heimdallarchaeota archaeon]